MRKILFFITIIIFALGVTQISYAQYNIPLQTDVSVEFNPETPVANQYVTATISSFSTDLNSASVSWILNGKTSASGKGLKTFSFTTGPSNTSTSLSISITTNTGEKIVKNFTFKLASVDLMWEASGYVPPFYKGKTLFSHQNKIKFIAIPHIKGANGAEIPASNLIYTWTRNGTILGDFSGYGKNTYTMISGVISRSLQIDVEVTSPSTNDVARASVTATPGEPFIVFYKKDPLYGIQLQKSLTGDVSMIGDKEINVLVEPFFFGISSLSDHSLQHKWSINNSLIDDGDMTKTSRVFRPKSGTIGSSNVSVSIENTNKMLQSASADFNLDFSGANN